MDAADFGSDARSIENLITELVLTRMAVVSQTDPDLAGEYEKLAVHGDIDPALYASVLRFAGQAGGVRRRANPGPLTDAA